MEHSCHRFKKIIEGHIKDIQKLIVNKSISDTVIDDKFTGLQNIIVFASLNNENIYYYIDMYIALYNTWNKSDNKHNIVSLLFKLRKYKNYDLSRYNIQSKL